MIFCSSRQVIGGMGCVSSLDNGGCTIIASNKAIFEESHWIYC
jgi:hypothetical protein